MKSGFDEKMIRRCIQLASNGLGRTYPNPMVGCVIVRNGKILAEGWHQKAGSPHAEVNAISKVADKELLKSSKLYVSLEPCSHYGKTPPCADLIASLQIPEVVIGSTDPNPKVAGRGIKKLKEAGVRVSFGILEEECKELNKRFFTFHQKKRPYIILKWAQTADGFMAPETDEQKWITGKEVKQLVHLWRTEENAILVGTRTAAIDNPSLTARLWEGNQPLRVVIDRNLSLSPTLHLFDQSQRTLVLTEKSAEDSDRIEYRTLDPTLPPAQAWTNAMYEAGIQSVIVEGGAGTLENFLKENLWDEIRLFTSKAKWGKGLDSPKFKGTPVETRMTGEDLLQIYTP